MFLEANFEIGMDSPEDLLCPSTLSDDLSSRNLVFITTREFDMILIPIFLMLFACWMLWGWTVGESKNIKWLRRWCAPIFVVTVMLMSAGAGAFITKGIVRRNVRDDVTKLLAIIEHEIRMGRGSEVVSEIQATDRSEDPDRDAFDLLDHIAVMEKNLASESETENVAELPGNSSTIR